MPTPMQRSFAGRAVPGKRRCTPEGMGFRCGCSAVGSAAPCQGAGRGFDPRHPLQVREHPQWDADGVAVKSAPITRIGKQDLPPRILTAEQEHGQAALDQNSPALEVVVVVAQWQSGGRSPQVAGSIPAHNQHAPLAQLAEASRSGREGSQFESGEGYHEAWLDNRRRLRERWV